MKPSDMNAYAREEVADGLLEWEKIRFDDPLLDSDLKEAIHRQVIRMRKILGKETPQFWFQATQPLVLSESVILNVPSTQGPLMWMVPAMREMAKDLPNNRADVLLKWANAIEHASSPVRANRNRAG